MAFGTRVLKYWVLGPSGKLTITATLLLSGEAPNLPYVIYNPLRDPWTPLQTDPQFIETPKYTIYHIQYSLSYTNICTLYHIHIHTYIYIYTTHQVEAPVEAQILETATYQKATWTLWPGNLEGGASSAGAASSSCRRRRRRGAPDRTG